MDLIQFPRIEVPSLSPSIAAAYGPDFSLLGPPVVPFYIYFGEGSPVEINYRKKVRTFIRTSLLEDLVFFSAGGDKEVFHCHLLRDPRKMRPLLLQGLEQSGFTQAGVRLSPGKGFGERSGVSFILLYFALGCFILLYFICYFLGGGRKPQLCLCGGGGATGNHTISSFPPFWGTKGDCVFFWEGGNKKKTTNFEGPLF